MGAQDFFVTEFAETIPLRKGYSLGCPPPYDCRVYDPAVPGDAESVFGIYSDLWESAIFFDWIQATPVLSGRRHARLLDIGGNTGLIARFLKHFGFADHTSCVDICDFSRSLDERMLQRIVSDVVKVEHDLADGAVGVRPTLLDRGIRKIARYRTRRSIVAECMSAFSTLQTMYPSRFPPVLRELPHHPVAGLDRYLHGNVFDLDERYDCITLFSSLDHFSPPRIFRKASELLEPGGRLYVWHINWFFVIFGPCVYGEFPYMAQRLTRKDIGRYFDEFAPEKKQAALKALSYWHDGELNNGEMAYTLSDYTRIAESCGLTTLATHRLRPLSGQVPVNIANWHFSGDHGEQTLKEVLRDVHHFHRTVCLDDLLTQSFHLAFEKSR